MLHRFLISATTATSETTHALTTRLTDTLARVRDTTITVELLPTNDDERTHNALESYAEKLARISSTLTLVARDFDVPQPYAGTLQRLSRKKTPSIDDEIFIARLERFAARTPMLARIRRFLVPLPTIPAFETLRFQQRLVCAQLDVTRLVDEPAVLDGTLLQAFEEYHTAYVRAYLHQFEAREAYLRTWRASLATLRARIDIIATLDELPALGAPIAPALTHELAQLDVTYRVLDIPPSERARILAAEPMIAGLPIDMPSPDTACDTFTARVDRALREKLTVICDTSVARVLASSREPSVKKLTTLLSLTHLEKITQLFTKKTTPIIIRELAKLLNTEHVIAIHFGDFIPSITELTHRADIDNLVAEFKTFLEQKLIDAQTVIVK